jgi:hypothetical protein
VAQAADDPLRRGNERTVFSFRLKNSSKHVSILESTDEENPYLVYRFGTATAVELEFPKDKKNSRDKFAYWGYMRGGGPENEGLDLNSLAFTGNGWQYVVYDDYAAVDESQNVGVRVIRLKDCKVTELVGRPESKTGSLSDLRGDDTLRSSEDISDSPCGGITH